ncbi:unnamed protein product, partial [Brachionus calyciflorus]
LPRFKDVLKQTTSSSLIESRIIQVIVSDFSYATSLGENGKNDVKIQSSTRSNFENKSLEEQKKTNGNYPLSDFESITSASVLTTSTQHGQISDNFTRELNQFVVNLINSNSFHGDFTNILDDLCEVHFNLHILIRQFSLTLFIFPLIPF